MKISPWLESLHPHLCEMKDGWATDLDNCNGIFYQLCRGDEDFCWNIRTTNEPKFQKTSWTVSAKIPGDATDKHWMEIFNANHLGWEYPNEEPQDFRCECGGTTFEIVLIFEPYEESETLDDMSWFWLWARCSHCARSHEIVNWEMD